ncbi:class I SAM-dependent DNA methyltransferase [Frigidibacter sp. ROC022]|uniref:class I SAM-dependent DNA methyltransferase n=1 Tax=Frigidibacter sp. ROC022 TaxID=2971796 RepID=UPI00215B23C5|nr:methyltransferase domain-containing protein [Frigidibacter sp. ROC022]MCR8726630.1 methyltransferase domain-containing protein [Frigidibacter sp. ROC022]
MLALPASSGDLAADRRLTWAEALAAEGDPAAAADLMEQTLATLPHWAAGWVRLGAFHEAAGNREAAAMAYDKAVLADPSDRLGASLRRDLLRPVPLGDTMPAAFVTTLFDTYAPGFEAALRGALDYRGPELIAEALRAVAPAGLGRVLDLGCGTGLLGPLLRPRCNWLEGCDLSSEMLRRAEAKGVYDRLEQADIKALAPVEAEWDTLAAADVVMYLGALEGMVGWASAALRPGGRLCFTAEADPDEDGSGPGYRLGPARRFRHGRGYLHGLLRQAGFGAARITPAVVRRDRGEPVHAFVVTASRESTRPETSDEDRALA